MSLAELAELAKLTISNPSNLVPTDGLWTSRSPIVLPPSPIPDRDIVPIPTQSLPIFPCFQLGLCANKSGDVYLYGGRNDTDGRRDVLYHYSIRDNTVTPLQYWGDAPGRRAGHAMILIGNVIAVHGGGTMHGEDPNLYLLNLVSREWSKIATSGDAPGVLRQHVMAAVGTTIYVFGGYEPDGTNSNKLWAFDLDTLHMGKPKWKLVKPSSQAQPTASNGATLVPYDDRLILFGGLSFCMDDIWSFDPKSKRWSELQCTGDVPPSRVSHTATILDDVMYIIGGSMSFAFLVGEFSDIFALKIPEQRWYKLKNTNTAPILARCQHASACIGTNIFVFGGSLGEKSEKHPVHILNANFIDNPNLHVPERLKEINAGEQVMRSQEKSDNDSRPQRTEASKRSRIISHILKYPSKMESLAQLQRDDAQMIVDFLADELGRQDIIRFNTHKRHILHFLSKLAKSTQVFPKSTELSDVQCNLAIPVNDEGGYGFIYKGVFRDQPVCVKAVRVSAPGPTGGKRSRGGKKSQTGETSQGDKKLRAQAGETVLLAHVSHPNVIPLYGTYLSSEESPRICIVSPWMDNGDLSAYLARFPNAPLIPLASDMAAGLGFLHDIGIIHADLKAKNVLVSQSQRAMLADFGIATVFHTNVGNTTSADYAGSTYWMAPELLVASARRETCPPTKASDMWGFACICYEIFCGEIPFLDRGFMPVSLMMAFTNGRKVTPLRPNEEDDPIDSDGDPISVDDEPWVPLAEGCWNFDPSDRPTAAEALQYLTELNVQDDRPSIDEELAMFKAVKDSRVEVEIDYSRVLSIFGTT